VETLGELAIGVAVVAGMQVAIRLGCWVVERWRS